MRIPQKLALLIGKGKNSRIATIMHVVDGDWEAMDRGDITDIRRHFAHLYKQVREILAAEKHDYSALPTYGRF